MSGSLLVYQTHQDQARHVGSIDVDLALNHRKLQEVGYRSILELLLSRGYQRGKQLFIFHRLIEVRGHEIDVTVDFLASEYTGTGRSHRTQKVQDMRPRKARGVDLVFDMPLRISITGRLPEGGNDSVEIQVASIPSFIVMKGIALENRLKEKDAWDIYYCLRHYPGGVEAIARGFQPWIDNRLVQEGLSNIAEKFSSPCQKTH